MNIDFLKPSLRFYFSFQCPYSYIAWEILKKLLKKSTIAVCPIEVGICPTGNTKFHFREVWGEDRWQRLIEDGAKLGIRITRITRYVSGINAARALESYGKSNAEDYITSVFRAVFLTGIDISLPTTLRMHLQSEGLDSSIFAQAVEDPRTERMALEQQLLWGIRRLREVPVVELEDERYSGYIEQSGLERFLRTILD